MGSRTSPITPATRPVSDLAANRWRSARRTCTASEETWGDHLW